MHARQTPTRPRGQDSQITHVEGCRIFQWVFHRLRLCLLLIAMIRPPALVAAVEVGAGLVEPIDSVPNNRHCRFLGMLFFGDVESTQATGLVVSRPQLLLPVLGSPVLVVRRASWMKLRLRPQSRPVNRCQKRVEWVLVTLSGCAVAV